MTPEQANRTYDTERDLARRLVENRSYVRIYSAAIHAGPPTVMAEGEVVGYCDQPTLLIREHDGRQSSWPISLPREVVTPELPDRETQLLREQHLHRTAPLHFVVPPAASPDAEEESQ